MAECSPPLPPPPQDDRSLTVWTSTLRRTIATARHLPKHYNQLQWKALDG